MPELPPPSECEDFLNFLYGEETGWVYAPVKRNGLWEKEHRFQWPQQRKDIVAHILSVADTGNAYIGTSLFMTAANGLIDNVKGSNVAWVDFDGDVPTSAELALAKVPEPSVRVQSSEGREHWYWKLDKFETDIKTIQDLTRSLAYAFETADAGAWAANKVLRPVGSVNHKPERNLDVSHIVKVKNKSYSEESFKGLAKVTSSVFDVKDLQALGNPKKVFDVIHSYTWTADEYSLIYKKPESGSRTIKRRGAILFRLASIAAEKGMDNHSIYSLIAGVDKLPPWRKFADRPTAELDYARLIDKVRQKHPYKSAAEQQYGFEIKTFLSHFEPEIKVDFLLEGYLVGKSINLIMGKSSSGKTMLAMAISRALVLKQSVMHWTNNLTRGQKILYFSYEMNTVENALRYTVWLENYSQDDISVLNENFLTVYPGDSPAKFYAPGDQERIKQIIEAQKPDGIIIDSASMSLAPHMTDEENVRRSMEFLRSLANKYNLYVFIIHHPRKDPPGTKTRLDDVDGAHGAQAIINQSTTAINITSVADPNAPVVVLEDLNAQQEHQKLVVSLDWRKYRLGAKPPGFHAELTPDLTFSRTVITTEYTERKAIEPPKEPRALPSARSAPANDTLARLAEEHRKNGRNKPKPPENDETF